MNTLMNKNLRIAGFVIGILLLVFTLGFVFQLPWAVNLWPWPDSRLSYLFIGSILAAVTVTVVWISWLGEWGALPGGALNVFVVAVTWTAYFLQRSFSGNHSPLLFYGIVGILIALVSAAAFLWSRRLPLHDTRPTPRFLLFSFGLFTVVLVLAAGALIFRFPTIFPWPLNPDSSVLFGCIFIGDAFYFFYGLLFPRWHNAYGQLLSFLAYDLVLIFPFLSLFSSVKPDHRLSLIIYVAVLLYSGLLAIYYLLLNRV
ncbi:MAG: hypothetical protein ACJ788_15445 [Ktedonobacteraceae bacterium]